MQNPISSTLAQHLRQNAEGGNWTVVHFQSLLADVTYAEAQRKMKGFNSIAELTYHVGYFLKAAQMVLDGKPLDAHDKFSFDLPQPFLPETWEQLRSGLVVDFQRISESVSRLDDEQLPKIFVMEKYGSWLRNLLGLLEHSHYHMGQIALLKKLYRSEGNGD